MQFAYATICIYAPLTGSTAASIKREAARVFADRTYLRMYTCIVPTYKMEKRNFSRRSAAALASALCTFAVEWHLCAVCAVRCAETYACATRARIYSAALTTRHPSGVPDEITWRTANIRGKLMHVFNSVAGWLSYCRDQPPSAPRKLALCANLHRARRGANPSRGPFYAVSILNTLKRRCIAT